MWRFALLVHLRRFRVTPGLPGRTHLELRILLRVGRVVSQGQHGQPSRVAAQWSLPRVAGARSHVPPGGLREPWRAHNLVYAQDRGVLYGSFPRTSAAGADEAVVLGLRLPDLDIVSEFGPFPTLSAPELLVHAEKDELLVSYSLESGGGRDPGDGSRDVISVLRMEDGRSVDRYTGALFGRRVSLAPDGSIYDGEGAKSHVILKPKGKAERIPVDVRTLLGDVRWGKLRELVRVVPGAEPKFSMGDTRRDRAIIVVSEPGRRRAIVYDLRGTEFVSPLIEMPGQGLMQLSDDGQRLVVGETQRIKGLADEGEYEVITDAWTGHFVAFEVKTGALEAEINVPQTMGPIGRKRLLCMSKDAHALFFGGAGRDGRRILGVQLAREGLVAEVASDFYADRSSECVIGDR